MFEKCGYARANCIYWMQFIFSDFCHFNLCHATNNRMGCWVVDIDQSILMGDETFPTNSNPPKYFFLFDARSKIR